MLDAAIVGISFLGSLSAPSAWRGSSQAGPLNLGFMAISALDFSSSLSSLRWFRAHVCAQCPGLEPHKYLDVCSSPSPAQSLIPPHDVRVILCSHCPCDRRAMHLSRGQQRYSSSLNLALLDPLTRNLQPGGSPNPRDAETPPVAAQILPVHF